RPPAPLARPGALRPRGRGAAWLAGPHDPPSAPAGAPVARLARYAARAQRVQNSRCEPHNGLDPGGFAPAAPPRLRSRGPTIPAPLRRARLWRAWPVTRLAHNEYKILAASRITG